MHTEFVCCTSIRLANSMFVTPRAYNCIYWITNVYFSRKKKSDILSQESDLKAKHNIKYLPFQKLEELVREFMLRIADVKNKSCVLELTNEMMQVAYLVT